MLRAKFLHWGQRVIARGAWFFAPLSFFYWLAVWIRNWLYNHQWLRSVKVKCVVVSVGNIVAGGTGKTPFVHLLASAFKGRKVAILSRGYGEVADEAMLLARRLPWVEVMVGKDRLALAQQTNADLVILDDGFQYRRLARDFDIVLVRNKKEHYLPWGFLRDLPSRLSGAIVFPTTDFQLKVRRILDLKENEVSSISGWKVGVFCGIANPKNFYHTVVKMGAVVEEVVEFGDHQRADLSRLDPRLVWICTEKDFVKLPPTALSIYFLEMEMEMGAGKERWEKVVEKIGQKIDNERHL